MSNCVTMLDGRLIIPPEGFHPTLVPAFWALVERSGALRDAPKKEGHLSEFYWYVSTQNVMRLPNGSILIDMEMGRSTHTFRSLKATLIMLSGFLRGTMTREFLATEEGDGYSREFVLRFTLSPGSQTFNW